MKENMDIEKEIMASRTEAIKVARAVKIAAENGKRNELETMLKEMVPTFEYQYESMLIMYSQRYPKSSEWEYLKSLLQLLKIVLKDKHLPPTQFTVSANQKKLASSILKQKLFKLI